MGHPPIIGLGGKQKPEKKQKNVAREKLDFK